MTISYHSHHSPIGADATFTVGKLGARGGFGLEIGRPADQDIYVGLRRGRGAAMSLPFFQSTTADGVEIYLVEGAAEQDVLASVLPIPEAQISRDLRWGTDTWTAPGVTFRLITPFAGIPDPAMSSPEAVCAAVVPAILAEVTFDNRDGAESATGFFALGNSAKPLRAVADETGGALCGVAFQREWGFAAQAAPGVETYIDFALVSALNAPKIARLGGSGGLLVRLAPGETRTVTVALGWYREGRATTGIDTTYYYTRFFTRLEDVLAYALAHADAMRATAEARDAELLTADLNDEQRFLFAQATRSYYGNTEFLQAAGAPLWVVNEGEYQMMNTFDLTVDMLFYELRWNPWTVRNVLDQFVTRYSYFDQVKHPDEPGAWYPGGLSFTHDMGVFNAFTPPGWSSYEQKDVPGCFSHMTHEQLVNWILCATQYLHRTGDGDWLLQRRGIFSECWHSLLHRDGRTPTEYDGVMTMDSSRTGETGQEITTYDSLDASLGQARNNLYLAVKTWAAYLALQRVFDQLGWGQMAADAAAAARRTAATVTAKFLPEEGFIPAVFEAGNASRIIPAVEGLAFPYLLGDREAVSETGPYGDFIRTLKAHLRTVLAPGVCVDAKGHWWKMSSTSANSWFSKVALCQFVARAVLGFDFGAEGIVYDRAHADWQRIGSSGWAMCDQIVDGVGLGSKYYPRGVSCILWLEESATTAVLTK
jgi:hypothetical protein